jgi:hypothetical protein
MSKSEICAYIFVNYEKHTDNEKIILDMVSSYLHSNDTLNSGLLQKFKEIVKK